MWAALTGGAQMDSEVNQLIEHFASKHLLTWLEALSIIGCMDIAYTSLDMVRKNVWSSAISHQPSRGDEICSRNMGITAELFNDGCGFNQRA
jgi:hypothetical protein